MQALQYKQFQHVTRFNHAGVTRPDIDGFVGVVRRLQEGEMKEAKGIMDLTFTVWVFVPAKGVNMRVRFESVNAEMAQRRIRVGQAIKFSGYLVPDRIVGWVRGTDFSVENPEPDGDQVGTASQKEQDSTL